MGGAELAVLHHVPDVGPEPGTVPEIGHDALLLVTDHEDEVAHAVGHQGMDDVLEDGAVADGQHHLRAAVRERSQPCPFPCCQNDGLHSIPFHFSIPIF